MGCQALQFRLGKLEEQLDSAECHASAATAAQADLTERESALVQELQEQLSVRETLQAQLGNVELDLHTTSQQRDLAIEQLSQFVAGPAAASFDACANGAYMYPQNTVVDSDQGSPESATIRSDQARNRALQELQSLSAEAHKEAQRLKRELEVSEACIASLRADVARADKEAAEATLERNQATQNAVRAECDLAAAQLRLSAVQQQEVDGDSLKRRFADSAECVKVRVTSIFMQCSTRATPYLQVIFRSFCLTLYLVPWLEAAPPPPSSPQGVYFRVKDLSSWANFN